MLKTEIVTDFDKNILKEILEIKSKVFPKEWEYEDAVEYYTEMLGRKDCINVFLKDNEKIIGYLLAIPHNFAVADMKEDDPNMKEDAERYYIDTAVILPEFQKGRGLIKLLHTMFDEAEKENKNNVLRKALSYKIRIVELSVGITVKQLIEWLFDYFVYPFVIYSFGIIKGGIVMTIVSFLSCMVAMKFYDWSKRDWLGIEAIKKLKGYEGSKKLGKVTAWFLTKSEPLIFLFLSIHYDPFITTAYLRKGAHQFNGMSRRDWKIFMGSLILGNTYWTLACYMGITLVEWGWKTVFN